MIVCSAALTVFLQCLGSSFSLSSTWVTSDVQERFFKAFQAELTLQAELMLTSLATRRNNAHLRNLGSDLLILQAKLHRAQAEMELYTMAIENSHAYGFYDSSKHRLIMLPSIVDALVGLSMSQDWIVPPCLPEDVDLIHNHEDVEDEDGDGGGSGSEDYDDIDVWML